MLDKALNRFDCFLEDYFFSYFFTVGFFMGVEISFVIALFQQVLIIK